MGGSAGGADAVYLPRPEQRAGVGRMPESGTCAGETDRRRLSRVSGGEASSAAERSRTAGAYDRAPASERAPGGEGPSQSPGRLPLLGAMLAVSGGGYVRR